MIASSRLSIFRKLWPDSLGAIHYLFAAVFLVRLVVLIRLAASPLLLPTGSDMHFYDEWAKQILHGQWTDHQAFYGLPLYPFLVALLYRVFGYGPFVPGFFQACLDAGTAVLIYKITVRAMGGSSREAGKAANLAGIIAAAIDLTDDELRRVIIPDGSYSRTVRDARADDVREVDVESLVRLHQRVAANLVVRLYTQRRRGVAQ